MVKNIDGAAGTPAPRRNDAAVRTLTHIISLLKIGLAIAIIVIIAVHLTNHDGFSCLLGTSNYGLCTYGYVVAALSLLFSIALAVLACLTCGLCHFMLGELALSVFGLLWWIAAGIVMTYYSHLGDDRRVPRDHWRHSIFAMCWAEAFLFFIMCLIYMAAGKKSRNNANNSNNTYTPQQDVEAQRPPQTTATGGVYEVPVAAVYVPQGQQRM